MHATKAHFHLVQLISQCRENNHGLLSLRVLINSKYGALDSCFGEGTANYILILTLVMLKQIYTVFANSEDPDRLASKEAN